MENQNRFVRRIDGEIVRLHNLTDEELDQYEQYAMAKIDAQMENLEHFATERERRANMELPLGKLALVKTEENDV